MPELPEVETTLQGILPYLKGQKIGEIVVRQPRLRWPIPPSIKKDLKNQVIIDISRRGKYLIIATPKGSLILHLGMSGSLRILNTALARATKHDHVDIILSNKTILRFNDPRRFGALLWTSEDPKQHVLLAELGPEPLTPAFSARYLWELAQKRKVPIKSFIMNSKVVVGVGNIYATEALFAAYIHPETLANQIDFAHYQLLVQQIKNILRYAIKQGGTTLRNFSKSDGKPGYFKLHLKAYGRKDLPCVNCNTTLKEIRLNQRSTVYCPRCQLIK